MVDERQLVLTVHGINSDGDWQDVVETLFQPYSHSMECYAFRYPEYRYAGFTRQRFSASWGLLCIFLLGCLTRSVLLAIWPHWGIWIAETPEINNPLAEYIGNGTRWFWYGWVLQLVALAIVAWLVTHPERSRARTKLLSMMTVVGLLFADVGLTAGPFAGSDGLLWLSSMLGIALVLFSVVEIERRYFLTGLTLHLGWWFWLESLAWRRAASVGLYLACQVGFFFWLVCAAGALVEGIRRRRRLANDWSGITLPLGMALLFAAGGLAVGGVMPRTVESTGVVLILLVFALAASYQSAPRRRAAVVQRLVKFIEEKLPNESADVVYRVFLIAHSLGTYLSAMALRAMENEPHYQSKVFPERLILVGSVLSPHHQWKVRSPWGESQYAAHIRNEVAGRDLVAKLAGVVGKLPLIRPMGFGDAGWSGFDGSDATLVHRVDNSMDFCESCLTREDRLVRRIHNVLVPTFGHSDAFVALERAERFWLPVILGYEPWEYWDFRRLCIELAAYGRVQQETAAKQAASMYQVGRLNQQLIGLLKGGRDDPEFQAVQLELQDAMGEVATLADRLEALGKRIQPREAQFLDRSWSWTENQGADSSFRAYLNKALLDKLVAAGQPLPDANNIADVENKVATAAKLVWDAVARSSDELGMLKKRVKDGEKPSDDDWKPVAMLNPAFAVRIAVKSIA